MQHKNLKEIGIILESFIRWPELSVFSEFPPNFMYEKNLLRHCNSVPILC